jgi:uridine phosphorylase
MTRDDIIRLAREAGAATGRHSPYQKNESIMPLCMDVERFAALVAAAEREACAKVCDDIAWSSEGKFFAKSIRARSNQTLLESKS